MTSPPSLPRPGRSTLASIATALVLFGCGGSSDDNGDESQEPEQSVDYAVLGVSGHCFGDCDHEYNTEYLEAGGTLERIADNLPDTADGRVEYQGYIDSYYNWENGEGELVALGFLQLVSDLVYLRDEAKVSVDGNRRLVVTCHSHGCVWAHIALFVVEEIEVSLLIDLDAESIGWETDSWTLGVGDDWADVIDEDGLRWPFDIACAGNCWTVDGVSELQDVEDIVPPWVDSNLEAASLDSTFIQDAEPNHYADGRTADVTRREFDLAHEDVDGRNSSAMDWIIGELPTSP